VSNIDARHARLRRAPSADRTLIFRLVSDRISRSAAEDGDGRKKDAASVALVARFVTGENGARGRI